MKIPIEVSQLIGTPYEVKDCWAIVREFYLHTFNIELKPYYDGLPKEKNDAREIIKSSTKDFVLARGELQFGDILLIRLFGVECHIAVYIGNGRILHTKKGTGCMVDRYATWSKSVSQTYRVAND